MDQIITVFTERRNLGITVIPYFAVSNNNETFKLLERVTIEHIKNDTQLFSDDEKELIETLHKISDRYLFKKYAKEGTLKSFFDNLHKDPRFQSMIRVHIEEYLYKTVRLIAKSSIPAYYKNGSYNNLYNSDLLVIEPNPAEPVFNFNLNQNKLLYSLEIRQFKASKNEYKDLSLLGRKINVILNDPAIFILNNQLYYFDNIDSKKFKPFTEKSSISIDSRQIPQYMEIFVANCIRKFHVVAKGFEISETELIPETILKIVKNINQKPAIALHFKYGDCDYLADRKSEVFVKLEPFDEKYKFIKIQRNLTFEQQIIDLLMSLNLKKIGDGLFDTVKDDYTTEILNPLADIAEWLIFNRNELENNNITIIPEYESNKLFIGDSSFTFDTKINNDWFEIHAVIEIGQHKIPFIRFRKNILDNDPVYKLPDGEVYMIPSEWFTRFSDLFNYSRIESKTIYIPRSHFAIINNIKNKSFRNKDGVKVPTVQLPAGLNAELRPYQIEGYQWLNFLYDNSYGGILADDMGLGKTLQSIALLLKIYQLEQKKTPNKIETLTQLSLFDQPEVKKFNTSGIPASLICMPTSLLFNWKDEFKKFAPFLRIYSYSGENRIRSKDIGKIFNHYHAVVISYGVLRNDIELLKLYNFHYLILDESQFVKNPSSKTHEAIKQIVANRRLMLTGTPVENSLMDLWTQMDLANHGLLGSQAFFKRHFIIPITKNNDEEKIAKLKKMIRPFFLRRTKDKVADELPPVMEQTLFCDMSPEQKSFYEREKSGIRNTISKIFEAKTPQETSIIALQALTRLRQIANHPVMVDKNFEGSSGKFDQIIENLENIVAEEHNVLVFSSFVKDLELLKTELKKRNLKFEMLTGATQNRKQVIESFSNNKDCNIFLISLKAGGVGLNLTKADYVFLLNPWWNPAAEAQAINRAHRIGQSKNVFVYRFLSSETIEEKIARLQQSKKQLADTFVNSNNPLKDLSKEEILELLG